MIPDVLTKLVQEGKASFGTYVSSAAQTVIELPKSSGIVITNIRLHGFCDLPPGKIFQQFDAVHKGCWHQLRVIGTMGINTFNTKHDIRIYLDDVSNKNNFLPQGYTDWEVFIPQENTFEIELANVGRYAPLMAITTAPLPADVLIYKNPDVPSGYGKTGIAGSLPTVETLTVGGVWQFRPFNKYTPSNPPGIDSRTQFQVPIVNNVTALQPPQPSIQFGIYTFPVIELKYILINKKTDYTFPKPISL